MAGVRGAYSLGLFHVFIGELDWCAKFVHPAVSISSPSGSLSERGRGAETSIAPGGFWSSMQIQERERPRGWVI